MAEPKTTTHYQIAGDGFTMSGHDWSGFDKRLSQQRRGELAEGEKVYGLDQAKQHVAELRQHKGEYAKYWQEVPLRIEMITTTTEVVVEEA